MLQFYLNDIVVWKIIDSTPEFGKIESIVYKDEKIYFIINRLKTIKFVEYLAGYEVEEIERENPLIDINDLTIGPLDLYCLQSIKIVVPKYNFIIE